MAVFCEYCSERTSFIKEEETLDGVRYYRTFTKFSSPRNLLVISKLNTGWGLHQLFCVLHVCTVLISSCANCRGLL
jgi:hypothetical protein